MKDLSLIIEVDMEGRIFLSVTVPSNFVHMEEETADVRIPIPTSVAPSIGAALIDCGNGLGESPARDDSDASYPHPLGADARITH